MPMVQIDSQGCRGCSLCVDYCPVKVFDRIENPKTSHYNAQVARADDCMGCFACFHLCPSQCIHVTDVEVQRPFYRVDENVLFVERFLAAGTVARTITEADWDEAYKDISETLVSLARATESIMGRGLKAVGRRAGIVAAPHFPEIYETGELAGRLDRLRQRFKHSFDFDFELAGDEIQFTFAPCGLRRVVAEEAGDKVGEAVLCRLFHDFLAGLVGVYANGTVFRHSLPEAGSTCRVVFSPTSQAG
jgi:2-oxoglutarate ferredoxin oxidoreductase subunit delta